MEQACHIARRKNCDWQHAVFQPVPNSPANASPGESSSATAPNVGPTVEVPLDPHSRAIRECLYRLAQRELS